MSGVKRGRREGEKFEMIIVLWTSLMWQLQSIKFHLLVLIGSPNEKIESCLTKRCRLELVDIKDVQLSWLLINEDGRFSSISEISVSCFESVFRFCSIYAFWKFCLNIDSLRRSVHESMDEEKLRFDSQ